MKTKDEIKLEIFELAQKISRASSSKTLTETTREMYEKAILLKYASDIKQTETKPQEPAVTVETPVVKAEPTPIARTTIDLFSAPAEPVAEPQAISPPISEPERMPEPVAEKPAPKPRKEPKKNAEESMAERLQHKRIADLKAAIGINEKFQFINELFEGNMKEYNCAVDQINSFSSSEEAETYLSNLETVYKWQADNPIAENFKELVERRFS